METQLSIYQKEAVNKQKERPMKKRVLSLISAFALMCGVLLGTQINVNAEESQARQVDGSYLTTEETSTGRVQSNPLLRGKYLMEGECSITRAGSGRIYVYGSTTANTTVGFVSVIVYVDQYNEEDDAWDQIDAWVLDDIDTYFVSTSKTLKVDKGYYYRVHCEHFAGNEEDYPYDSAISYTDGIWID